MDKTNEWSLQDSPEFWFSSKGNRLRSKPDLADCMSILGDSGAGAKAHMDEHCTTTLSVQLDGEKRWRLGWMPPPKDGVRSKQSIYSDGAVYTMNKGILLPILTQY